MMGKFLISTMPAVGHVTPFLTTATKLVERGHEVWWHTGIEVKQRIEATGAQFVPMEHTRDIVQITREAEQKKGIEAVNQALINLFVEPMLGQLQDYKNIMRDFKADVLLVDMCSLGACLLSEDGGPVWVSVGINPLQTPESPMYGSGKPPARSSIQRYGNRITNWISNHVVLKHVNAEFNKRRHLIGRTPIRRGTVFDHLMSPYLHLQGTTSLFEFPYKDIPPQVHFVGPMLPPMSEDFQLPSWWSEMLSSSKPIVHVTQGTVATDIHELVGPTVEAMASEDVLLIVTTPNPEELGTVPPNVRVERMIPHSLLLPHVDVMVTNGGYNGVKMALWHGVPLVAAGATEDKPEVCSRIDYSNTGINLKTGSPTRDQIKQAVLKVLNDPGFKNNASKVRDEFRAYEDANLPIQLLERLVSTQKPVYRKV